MSSSPPPPLPASPAKADALALGAPSNAPAPVVTEAAPPAKDEPKKPLVDPKLALLIPFGIFAAFAFLSLIVVVYALIFKPKPISAESSGASEPASAVTQP